MSKVKEAKRNNNRTLQDGERLENNNLELYKPYTTG